MRTGPGGATMSMSVTIPTQTGRAVRITVDLGLCGGATRGRLVPHRARHRPGLRQQRRHDQGRAARRRRRGRVAGDEAQRRHEAPRRGRDQREAQVHRDRPHRDGTRRSTTAGGRLRAATHRSTQGDDLDAQRAIPRGDREPRRPAIVPRAYELPGGAIGRARGCDHLCAEASDESWSKFVDEAIKKFRERETAWQKPVCAGSRSHRGRTRSAFDSASKACSRARCAPARRERGGRMADHRRRNLGLRPGATPRLPWTRYRYRVDGEGRVSATSRCPRGQASRKARGSREDRRSRAESAGRSRGARATASRSRGRGGHLLRNDSRSGVDRGGTRSSRSRLRRRTP